MRRGGVALAWLLLAGCSGGLVGERFEPPRYTVVPGDTLYSIAWRYQLNHRDLIRWNAIAPPFTIYPGQEIALRPPARAAGNPPQGETSLLKLPVAPGRARTAAPARPGTVPAPSATRPAPVAPPAGNWLWPTSGRVVERFDARNKRSLGIDIAGQEGQSVRAAAAGHIVYSGSGIPRYGRLVIVKHDDSYLSAYAYNRRLLVHEGAQVEAGQAIAEMGRDDDDRTRLHFEIRRDGKPVDPLRYLRP